MLVCGFARLAWPFWGQSNSDIQARGRYGMMGSEISISFVAQGFIAGATLKGSADGWMDGRNRMDGWMDRFIHGGSLC
jgi:hypothetical protein